MAPAAPLLLVTAAVFAAPLPAKAAAASSSACAAGADVRPQADETSLIQTRTRKVRHASLASPSLHYAEALLSLARSARHAPLGEVQASADPEQVTAWKAYRPCGACKQFVRVGEGGDGGYLMCGELLDSATGAYSYGISGFDGWGAMLSNRNGLTVQQYDCFDLHHPACPSGMNCNFNFHGECLSITPGVQDGKSFGTLAQHMAANGHAPGAAGGNASLVMKMDIEGGEWDVLADDSALPLLDRFSQLVVEFHNTDWATPAQLQALQNLLKVFTVVHIHGNNCCLPAKTQEGYVVPSYMEVTFVKRGLVAEGECTTTPTASLLDAPNLPPPKWEPLPQTKLPA